MQRSNFRFTPAQKADAREALRRLEGSGFSLVYAADHVLQGKRALKRVLVKEAAEAFLRSKLERRAASFEWYEVRLGFIVGEFGERVMDSVTRAELRHWLEVDLQTGAAAKAAIARCARALWRWALKQEPPLAAVDITVGLTFEVKAREGKQPLVLTPEQCEKILRGAGRHRSALALMMFAGVRPSEVCDKDKPWLTWRHVSVKEKWIRIPDEIAKTGRARIIEGLPPTLWRWLQPAENPDVTVGAVNSNWMLRVAARLSGLNTDETKAWEADALRHTAATYLLIHTNDPGQVALWLGHEEDPTMLHTRYRGLAFREAAKAFFALRPE